MFAVLLACALSTCQSTYDLANYSGYGSVSLSPGSLYCLRFTAPHGIFVANKIGYATAALYYASSGYYSDESSYSWDSTMFNAYSTLGPSRGVSFGNYYGFVLLVTSTSTSVYYTYSYANSTCTYISLSSKMNQTYSFPNNSAYYYSSSTYCFVYMTYGAKTATVTRYINSVTSSDQMYYRVGDDHGTVNDTVTAFQSITYPLQLQYIPLQSGYDRRYNISVSTTGGYYDNEIEGTFASSSKVSKIRLSEYYGETTESSSETTKTSTALTVGCTIGGIIIGAAIFILVRRSKRIKDSSDAGDYDEISLSSLTLGLTDSQPSPSDTIVPPQTFGEYHPPPNA